MSERNHNLPTPAEAEALNQLGLFAAAHESYYPDSPSSLMGVLSQLDRFCIKAVEGLIRKFPDFAVFEATGHPKYPVYHYLAPGAETLSAWHRASAGVIPGIDQTTARASIDIPKGKHLASADLSLCEAGHQKFTLRCERGADEMSPLNLTEVDLRCGTAFTYLKSVQGLAVLRNGECSLEPEIPGQLIDLGNLRPDERAMYVEYEEVGLVAGALMDSVRHLAEVANAS